MPRIIEILEDAKFKRIIDNFKKIDDGPFGIYYYRIKFDNNKYLMIIGEDHERIRKFSNEENLTFYEARSLVINYILEKIVLKYYSKKRRYEEFKKVFALESSHPKEIHAIRIPEDWETYTISYKNHFSNGKRRKRKKYELPRSLRKRFEDFLKNYNIIVIYCGKAHTKDVLLFFISKYRDFLFNN